MPMVILVPIRMVPRVSQFLSFFPCLQKRNNVESIAVKLISGFCRTDTPADPFKKPYAVVFFQLFYRQAYRRLGKVKLSGGFRNAAVLIYSHKYFIWRRVIEFSPDIYKFIMIIIE